MLKDPGVQAIRVVVGAYPSRRGSEDCMVIGRGETSPGLPRRSIQCRNSAMLKWWQGNVFRGGAAYAVLSWKGWCFARVSTTGRRQYVIVLRDNFWYLFRPSGQDQKQNQYQCKYLYWALIFLFKPKNVSKSLPFPLCIYPLVFWINFLYRIDIDMDMWIYIYMYIWICILMCSSVNEGLIYRYINLRITKINTKTHVCVYVCVCPCVKM